METNSSRPRIFLYTDGASSGNPGPGGYGVVLKCAGHEKEMSGGFARTTNNRMELLAVIKGLEAIKWRNAEVEVYSDSSYVVKAVNEAFPTVMTSGTIMTVAGLLIAYRVSDVYIGHIGLAVGRGALISVILVMTVLPQLIVLLDKVIEKTTFGKKAGD